MYFLPQSVSILRLFLQFATLRTLRPSHGTLRSKRQESVRNELFNMVTTQPTTSNVQNFRQRGFEPPTWNGPAVTSSTYNLCCCNNFKSEQHQLAAAWLSSYLFASLNGALSPEEGPPPECPQMTDGWLQVSAWPQVRHPSLLLLTGASSSRQTTHLFLLQAALAPGARVGASCTEHAVTLSCSTTS